jgi:hypothetical protein
MQVNTPQYHAKGSKKGGWVSGYSLGEDPPVEEFVAGCSGGVIFS